MDTKDAQRLMRKVYWERDKERGIEGTLKRTFEELEELSEAVAQDLSREEIMAEVADVYAWLCSVANLLDIDLSYALLSKYQGACSKCGGVPCCCPPERYSDVD
jgi:NTP pyrophosphatase (non-canonical NTP hydrolase)